MTHILTWHIQGGVNLNTIGEIAKSGVDRISVGGLTHQAVNIDVGLDADWTQRKPQMHVESHDDTSRGVTVTWCHGHVVSRSRGVMVTWCHGHVVSRSYSVTRLTRSRSVTVTWCHQVNTVTWCHKVTQSRGVPDHTKCFSRKKAVDADTWAQASAALQEIGRIMSAWTLPTAHLVWRSRAPNPQAFSW